jgi:hypothetical protein
MTAEEADRRLQRLRRNTMSNPRFPQSGKPGVTLFVGQRLL